MSNKLIHDLRNKLQPIRTYFDLLRLSESNRSQKDRQFIDGWKEGKLLDQIEKAKLQCEPSLAQIVYIIEQLENPTTNDTTYS